MFADAMVALICQHIMDINLHLYMHLHIDMMCINLDCPSIATESLCLEQGLPTSASLSPMPQLNSSLRHIQGVCLCLEVEGRRLHNDCMQC